MSDLLLEPTGLFAGGPSAEGSFTATLKAPKNMWRAGQWETRSSQAWDGQDIQRQGIWRGSDGAYVPKGFPFFFFFFFSTIWEAGPRRRAWTATRFGEEDGWLGSFERISLQHDLPAKGFGKLGWCFYCPAQAVNCEK